MSAAGLIEVVAAVIWRGREFLAVKRPQGKDYAGWWEFPGGKVEPGETLEQALCRELLEELGIRPVRVEFWMDKGHRYPEYSVRLHFFHVRSFTGALSRLEGQDYAWMEPGPAGDRRFLPADVEVLRALAVQGAGSKMGRH
ncbi:MAG: (deoxy)nucleoside triphosphate pyrophosphohydrolase [Desulfovibrionaceae bacterium]|nr:(deoxy)nucleoside triphosphate pyrophosphohydrolase [Desulfovibrionaceae bacterium]